MEHRSPHALILYVLVFVIAAWLVITSISFTRFKDDQGKWVCSNVVCEQYINGQEWAQRNCFLAPGANNTQTYMCKVVINSQSQLVPITALNLSAIQQCVAYSCNQEVNVRVANYSINVTGTQ